MYFKSMLRIFISVILFGFSVFSVSESFAESEKSGFAAQDYIYNSKSTISGEKYMVVSGTYLSSKVGKEILEKGGNAIDALIAIQMVLNVIQPQSSGIGGGSFLLYYDAKSKILHGFDGRETAPGNADSDLFLNRHKMPLYFFEAVKGGISVGVPGTLKLLKEVHLKYGKLDWEELFKPAIDIASSGFLISPRLNFLLKKVHHVHDSEAILNLFFDKEYRVKKVGTKVKNPALAKTFSLIAKKGISDFYSGSIAKNIVKTVQNSDLYPGKLSLEDLKSYEAKEREVLCILYRAYKVCSVNLPSAGGLSTLQILGILERFNFPKFIPYSGKALHIIAEAMKLVYADKNTYLADEDFVKVPVDKLLDKGYLYKRSMLIDSESVNKRVYEHGDIDTDFPTSLPFFEKPSTTHISVIDEEGNAVSMTSSIEFAFGSALMTDGFLLNSELANFSFEPKKEGKLIANRVEGGKRPLSSMSPIIVFDSDDNVKLVLGSPGGPRIEAYIINVLIAILDWNLGIQQAIDAPHYLSINQGFLELEENRNLEALKEDLNKRGHYAIFKPHTSGLHGINIKNKFFFSGVDPRREGFAFGK